MPAESPQALAEGWRVMLDRSDAASFELSVKAKRRIDNFSVERKVIATEDAFQRLIR